MGTSIKVPFDNFQQNGDQSLSQIMADVQALSGGESANAAEVIRDPSTGKLIQVILNGVLNNAVANALAKINANPGVTGATPIPDQFLAQDLDATAGVTFTGDLEAGTIAAGSAHDINVIVAGTFNRLEDTGTGDTYTDAAAALAPGAVNINFLIRTNATTPFVIADGSVTLKPISGPSVTISLTNTITLPVPTVLFSSVEFFIDATGKLYKNFEIVNDVVILSGLTYEQAVIQSGAQ